MIKKILFFAQIIIPVFLVAGILLQQRGTALGSLFGGEGGFYLKKRGLEKIIFWATVVFGTLFLLVSLLNLIIH